MTGATVSSGATILFDYDPIIYSAAAIGETRSIKSIHRKSGNEYTFKNRTEFWGRDKAKATGWLKEYNKKNPEREPEEFDIIDIQTPHPIANCLQVAKTMITNVCEALDISKYYGYSGRGKVFREDISTILKYKGNRDNTIRPIHLEDLKVYIEKYHACEIITGIEADDACSIDSANSYRVWKQSGNDSDKLVLAYVDKDYLQVAGNLYNTNTKSDICSYEGFGWLAPNEKGDIKGRGRLWLYHQTLSGDTSDNYCANSACDTKWGEKSSYKLLKDCKNDKEAWQAMVDGYYMLYPTHSIVMGWRGEVTVDALYMLQENFNLAKMLRSVDEKPTNVRKILNDLGIEYE